jgi:nucleoside-diphosphate-sugar epimerase
MVTTRSEMSIEKIRRRLGWRPRYTFSAAIDELRRWYATRREPSPEPD